MHETGRAALLYSGFLETSIMGILRGPSMQWILPAALMVFGTMAHAACNGPQALTEKLRAHPTSENAIALGGWFASHQQFECAVETFRGAIKADPKSAQLHYLEGLALVDGGHPGDALPALQESVRLEPQVIKPHLMLAYAYDHAAQHAKAEEQWKQALGIDPHAIPALEGLSGDLLARQDYTGVVGLLQSAPRTEKLAISLARAYGTLNYLDEASAVLTEALKLSPGSVPLASAMTVVLIKQVRYEDAIKLLEQTVEKNPGNMDAEVQLFRVLVLTNHMNLARPIGPKLLTQRPHDPEVLYLNGIVERSVGDYAQSKAHLEEAVKLDPEFFNSRYNLGMVLVFLHEWKEAAEHLEKAISLGAPEPQVHFELAKALRGLGENDRAAEEMKLYQQLKKSEEAKLEAATSAAQGDTDLAAGKLTEAIAHYREAAEGEPDNASFEFKLAIALDKVGDTEGERAQLMAAVKLNPDLAGAQKQLGYLLARSGDAAGAIEHFRMAVRAAPAWVEAWVSLAAELAEDGHFSDAKEAVATALRLEPGNAAARELSDQLARDPAAQQAHP